MPQADWERQQWPRAPTPERLPVTMEPPSASPSRETRRGGRGQGAGKADSGHQTGKTTKKSPVEQSRGHDRSREPGGRPAQSHEKEQVC